MANIKKVMISSTTQDLPLHRRQAMDACISQDMFPSMMEYLPASPDDAVAASLRMVDEADIYIGVFAYRYGFCPEGYTRSITEIEYDRARERGIPILLFLIHDSHPVKGLDIETGDGADSLERLKGRMKTDHVVNFFMSPEDLRAKIAHSLSKLTDNANVQPRVESKKFSSSIQKQMSTLNKTIDTLTTEQYEVLTGLRYHKRVTIAGCAGSGKTLLVAEKSLRLDAAGYRTLILCHSRYLANYIAQLVAGSGVKVLDFTSWINQIIQQTDQEQEEWSYYEEPTDEMLEKAFDQLLNSKERYDAILVDEGQDFRSIWWTIVELALASQEFGVFYIFFDDNQALLPKNSTYPIEQASIPLSKNVRNTGQIYELIRRLHSQAPHASAELKNLGIVEQWFYTSLEKIHEAVRASLRSCLKMMPAQSLVVLTMEQEPVRDSTLNGLEVELNFARSWQDVVYENLWNSRGVLTLSTESLPTREDVRAVYEFAKANYPKGWEAPEQIRKNQHFAWGENDEGIQLRGKFGPAFFFSENWSEGIPQPRKIKVIANAHSTEDTIALFTVSSYKGLESDGVVLFIPSPYLGTKSQFEASYYVGLSRAKFLLHLIGDTSLYYSEQYMKAFGKHFEEYVLHKV